MVNNPHSVLEPCPTGRRERRRLETEDKLMACALELFNQHGYAATTVEQITAAADVAKGTFFNYFPTKEHLLLAMFQRKADQFRNALTHVDEFSSTREFLTRFVHEFIEYPFRTQLLLREAIGLGCSHPVLAEEFRRTAAFGRKFLTQVFKRGQVRSEVRKDLSAEDLARTFQQMMLGAQMVWGASGQERAQLHRWIDASMKIFWRAAEAVPSRKGPGRKKETATR